MVKITKEVKVRAKVVKTPAKVKKVTKIYCDFCNATLPDHGSYGWYPSCSVCDRDTCKKHNHRANDWDDYADWYCDICVNIYPKQLEELESRHYDEKEALKNKVKKESLNYGKA